MHLLGYRADKAGEPNDVFNAAKVDLCRLKTNVSCGLRRDLARSIEVKRSNLAFAMAFVREQRQAHQALPQARRFGQVLGFPSEGLLVIGVQVQRAPMDGAAHAVLPQLIHEPVAVDPQAVQPQSDGEQVPGVDAVRLRHGQFDLFDVLQGLDIAGRDRCDRRFPYAWFGICRERTDACDDPSVSGERKREDPRSQRSRWP